MLLERTEAAEIGWPLPPRLSGEELKGRLDGKIKPSGPPDAGANALARSAEILRTDRRLL